MYNIPARLWWLNIFFLILNIGFALTGSMINFYAAVFQLICLAFIFIVSNDR